MIQNLVAQNVVPSVGSIFLTSLGEKSCRFLITEIHRGPFDIARVVPLTMAFRPEMTDKVIIGRDECGVGWLAHCYGEGPILLEELRYFESRVSAEDLGRVRQAVGRATMNEGRLGQLEYAFRLGHVRRWSQFWYATWRRLYEFLGE